MPTDELVKGMSAVDWARKHGMRWRGHVALDNREPWHRNHEEAVLDCYSARGHQDEPIWVLDHRGLLKPDSTFIMDDGQNVVPWYVAGWHPERQYILLHRFPTNLDEHGDPILRADDQRPVDYSTWMLGPRRAYHVKLKEAS